MKSLKMGFLVLFALFFLVTTQVRSQAGGEEDIITNEERELVGKLRTMVKDIIYKDYMNEDEYLVRFLRVQQYNLERAKEKIANAVKWRKENKIDSVLTEDFSLVENEYPIIFEGTDNYGRPLIIVSASVIDFRKIVLSGHLNKFLRFFDALLEMCEVVLREMKSGPEAILYKNVTRGYIVADLNGFNLRQHACLQCLPFIPRLLNTYENYYPDMLYRVVSVNTPSTFLPIFELIRPFLSPPTGKAVRLMNHDREKWQALLRNEVPEQYLPKAFGGSATSVIPKTMKQFRATNPHVEAAFRKALEEQRQQSNVI